MSLIAGTTKYIQIILNLGLALLSLLITPPLTAQHREPVSYVNPFIGTAKSSVATKWGGEGGTYPGAVAPAGYIQLSPETRVTGARGYDFSDSVIYYFSCLHHFSGFPSGSAGELLVMPVNSGAGFQPAVYKRRFSHQDEKASPGYYRVLFRDDETLVEATATTRAGMFRFTFPAGVRPQLFISDSGRFHAAFRFSEPYTGKQAVKGGYLLTFAPATKERKVILLGLSASTLSKESAERNIAAELNDEFDQLKENARREWNKVLSVIEIADSNEVNKTIFYTALYHSLLMPWVISDADGYYSGADGKAHGVQGRNAYGGFSPWDTFRSLHPLLCLLYPDKQREMVLSMLDVFQQTGYLPTESMTGNHALPIVADSYLKGIGGIDSSLAYTAMKKSIADTPYLQPDMEVFRQQGYIPFTYPESVTRTVEYAYDDWVLAQFAAKVMRQPADYRRFLQSSYAYRYLFQPDAMSFLPRKDSLFKSQPGTSGYKEGDQWIYSYFAPQHQQDLINLMGGRQLFTARLDAALREGQIIFDNETVFHIPWLFNAAGAPQQTQKWIGEIMRRRFGATPGGLPGNDDLGAMSSWYVLSAMGIYPLCPGEPVYTIGKPLFSALRVKLQNGRSLLIKRNGAFPYISALKVNDTPYQALTIPHERIMQGATLLFETAAAAAWPDSIPEQGRPDFQLQQCSLSQTSVHPHERFYARFSLTNKGSTGTRQVRLYHGDSLLGYKNCLLDSGVTIIDSISCRLYREGQQHLTIDHVKDLVVTVLKPDHPYPDQPEIRELELSSLIRKGNRQQYSFIVQNTGGEPRTFHIPVRLDDKLLFRETVQLQAGELKHVRRQFTTPGEGWHILQIYRQQEKFKVYNDHTAALLLDLAPFQHRDGNLVRDASGFRHHGHIIRSGKDSAHPRLLLGEDCFIEIPNARSLDLMGNTITMMAWVYPVATTRGLTDLLTKGDVHVLQVSGDKTLTFFAGGWGRGECSAALPENWKNHWHHIAGVCDGNSLRLYIDGQLKGFTPLEDTANLSVNNKWNIGRNEEFPFARIFNGYMDKVKVFAAPLSEAEIRRVMGAQPEYTNGASLEK